MQSVSVIIVAVLLLSSTSVLLKATSPKVAPVFKFATILYIGILTLILGAFDFLFIKGSIRSTNACALIIIFSVNPDF